VFFGGLIGSLEQKGSVRISGCHVTMVPLSLSGNNIYFGGFIGYNGGTQNSYSTNIENSSWSALGTTTISAGNGLRIGGMIGQKGSASLTVTDCTISGSISGSSVDSYVGYLVGNSTIQYANTSNIDVSGFSVTLNGSPITVNQFGNH
jgi:hypothetical protein